MLRTSLPPSLTAVLVRLSPCRGMVRINYKYGALLVEDGEIMLPHQVGIHMEIKLWMQVLHSLFALEEQDLVLVSAG